MIIENKIFIASACNIIITASALQFKIMLILCIKIRKVNVDNQVDGNGFETCQDVSDAEKVSHLLQIILKSHLIIMDVS